MTTGELSAAAALELWETADALGPVERALALAAAAGPDTREVHELAELPVGRRDARLLMLHRALAGAALEATASCPECGQEAEFTVDADALAAQLPPPAPEPAAVALDGFVVAWRPPDSRDVAAAAATGSAAAAEGVLLSRCVTSARGPAGDVDRCALPPHVREALARAMAEADPLAEIVVDVVCPSCAAAFAADVDVAAFVWARLRAHARRLLSEVDTLARAYGWTEADVLALGAQRRAAYLELAGAPA